MTMPQVETPFKLRQAERSERSTKAMLEAAADLIVEGGFGALTLASIGEKSGYSRGLATSRFGSKDGLIDALIKRIVGRWSHRNILPHAEDELGLDGVLVILEAIRAQAERDPHGLKVLYALFFEAVGPDDALRSRFARFHSTMRADIAGLLQKGVKDGTVVPEINVHLEAEMIVSGLRGLGYQWTLAPEEVDFVESLRYLIQATKSRLATSYSVTATKEHG
jgi:AcrR family transcriptional regulator